MPIHAPSSRALVELMKIMQFGDAALPTGAFAFSNGLESALQTGVVHDPETLKNFIMTLVEQAANMDGVALLNAHRSARRNAMDAVVAADRTLIIRKPSHEQRLMTTRMGKKLGELARAIIDDLRIGIWLDAIADKTAPGCYPIGHAVIFSCMNVSEAEAFAAHQYGVAQMMLGAALRLMRIDHYATQKILFAINERVDADYARIKNRQLCDMASFAPVFDILAAHHTTTHVRMFMS